MLLEIRDLHVQYGRAEALRGVSLTLEEGAVVALLGANGAGKTTTLRTISGLKRVSRGEIWYRGKRIDNLAPHEIVRQGIAHVPEDRQLFYGLSVKQNLDMGSFSVKGKKDMESKLGFMLERFPNLRHKLKSQATDLSGGEQQMVAVARALMSNPKVLLMDEPSLGLSPIMVNEVARIIKDISHAGVTILLVEQNARMALRLADFAYVLEAGTVVLSGEAKFIEKEEQIAKAYLGG
jgi:branched-chain amino acid transport system ATP-binding protein